MTVCAKSYLDWPRGSRSSSRESSACSPGNAGFPEPCADARWQVISPQTAWRSSDAGSLLHRPPGLRLGHLDRHRAGRLDVAGRACRSPSIPEITPPTIQVACQYPGANAQVVADTVAAPIEQQINGVENMMYMSSQSNNDGSYSLTVTFKLGVDLDTAQVHGAEPRRRRRCRRCPTWSRPRASPSRSNRRAFCWSSISIPTSTRRPASPISISFT